jgi:hypothetical protein
MFIFVYPTLYPDTPAKAGAGALLRCEFEPDPGLRRDDEKMVKRVSCSAKLPKCIIQYFQYL